MSTRHRRILALSLLLAALSGVPAMAAGPAPSAGAWADPDPAASHVPLPQGLPAAMAGTQRLRAVERALRHAPDDPNLLRERGFLRYRRGEVDAAEADYAHALQRAAAAPDLRRNLLWSRGWARFDAGRNDEALASWQEAVALHGGRPFWWPYSAALAEWRAGREEAAIRLYAEAVRAMPEWGRNDGVAARTAHWTTPQQDTARAVFEAWQAKAGG